MPANIRQQLGSDVFSLPLSITTRDVALKTQLAPSTEQDHSTQHSAHTAPTRPRITPRDKSQPKPDSSRHRDKPKPPHVLHNTTMPSPAKKRLAEHPPRSSMPRRSINLPDSTGTIQCAPRAGARVGGGKGNLVVYHYY